MTLLLHNMMYQITLRKRVKKELENIDKKYLNKIHKKLFLLSQNPFEGKDLSGKLKSIRSIRAWPFRILYIINLQTSCIEIVLIQHRKDVYKRK